MRRRRRAGAALTINKSLVPSPSGDRYHQTHKKQQRPKRHLVLHGVVSVLTVSPENSRQETRADTKTPCTREEAAGILTRIAAAAYPAKPVPDIAAAVERLQTLPDADLSVLTKSPDTFAIVESNRRFLAALQKESRRTTYLTILIAVVAVLTLIVAGLEIYDEYFRPD